MSQNIQFLFGKVPTEFLDNGNEYFVHNDGSSYYFSLTTDAEHIYLADTCGRSVPIDLEFISPFALGVDTIFEVTDAYKEAEYMLQNRLAQIAADVELFKETFGE